MAISWPQLLALTLKPDRSAVLAVGRHEDSHVQVSDPRASMLHFEIFTTSASQNELSFKCFLIDRSSNGTFVNGKVVGKGKSCPLHTGDEIEVLPKNRVGEDEMIAFLFRNSTNLSQKGVQSIEVLEDLVLCPICMQPIYKCVALMPCSHNFCMTCCSDWMGQKADCPLCRRKIRAVMKNHPMDSVVEAYLVARPQCRRSDEELMDMEMRDTLRLGQSGKLVLDLCHVAALTGGSGGPTGHVAGPTNAESQPERQQVNPSRDYPRRDWISRGSQVCSLQ